jgi:hypothetical protein
MDALHIEPTPAPALPPADEIVTLPAGSQAACAVCWRQAVVTVQGRNLCSGCGAFILNGSEDYGPWLD